MPDSEPVASRRRFLKYLAASPVLAAAGLDAGFIGDLLAAPDAPAVKLDRLMRLIHEQPGDRSPRRRTP